MSPCAGRSSPSRGLMAHAMPAVTCATRRAAYPVGRLWLTNLLSGPLKDRMTRLGLLGALLASLASSGCGLFCIACEGALGADGQVFEWVGAPPGTNSSVHVDAVDWVKPDGLVPLQGAELVLEPWTPEKRPSNPDTARLWTRRARSDAAGAFTMGRHCKARVVQGNVRRPARRISATRTHLHARPFPSQGDRRPCACGTGRITTRCS